MAPSVNEQLADRAAAHAIDLVRFDSDARARVLGYLRLLEAKLSEQLSNANLGGGMTEFRRTRAETLLRQVRETIAEAYADMADAADGVLRGLAEVESATAMAGVGKFIVETRFELNILTPAQLSRIVDATLIQGAPSRAWWQAQAGDLLERFSSAIREGVGLGETNDELVRRVRGRATWKRHVYELNGKRHTYVEFRGGLMDTSTRHAEALVRTSVQSIAGQTRRDTFAENQDVVKGIVQVSTLDTRTTVTCRARAAKAWSLPDYQPIDHSIAYGGGVPLHWGCRSTEAPLLRSWQELGIDLDDAPGGAKRWSRLDGKVPADFTMEQFLRRRSREQQDEMLGPGIAALWRARKVSLEELIDAQSGRPLALWEVQMRAAA